MRKNEIVIVLIYLFSQLFIWNNLWAQSINSSAYPKIDSFDLGNKIFKGEIHVRSKNTCISCHNTIETDSTNLYPSAYDIGVICKKKSFNEIKEALLEPFFFSDALSEAHDSIDLSDIQIKAIISYLKAIEKEGPVEIKPDKSRKWLIIVLSLFFLMVFIELFYIRHFKKIKFILFSVLTIIFLAILILLINESNKLGLQKGYQPGQPIKFSHNLHYKENKIECLYCHTTAEYSPKASIPSANVCMNCHTLVREGKYSGEHELKKLFKAWENKTPVEWTRVNSLPDYVFFDHSIHVKAGNINCVECHGRVEDYHEQRQENALTMGWCIDCHRTRKVDFTNKYYNNFRELHSKIDSSLIDSVLVTDVGGQDCMKCHY